MLSDKYGYSLEQSRWLIGGLRTAMKPFDFVGFIRSAAVDVTKALADNP